MRHRIQAQKEDRGPYEESEVFTSDLAQSLFNQSKKLVEVGMNPLFALAAGLATQESLETPGRTYSR